MPNMGAALADTLSRVQQGSWSIETCLLYLLERAVEGRRRRHIERFMKQSQLPPGKTSAQLDQRRLPLRIRRLLPQLQTGDLIDQCQNILFFGLPGAGQTRYAAAPGHALVGAGHNHSVLFTPTFMLVGRMLQAKGDYEFERELRRLERFGVIIFDDIDYVKQSRANMEVLFTFIAENATSGAV